MSAQTNHEGMTCLDCHTSNKENKEGKLLVKDSSQEVCAKCHKGETLDVDKIMVGEFH
ncbi:hypothetical protein BR63_00635 [Thermanaerosceptrum fracticalcis]|uniref:Doubled CXXCH motif domain-containing protein n=1 Tax=Thermanaerosceptrum fracticalcis TaxID=1712410 RepID=A0A7G6DYQ5_THEFR|nr:cytochrome c3 family protein [Thermanaerosceptrum fracticalcis]QNB44959.1 hypothetical protein BR63_00635 [Thermanaerosceptrum fracticalcis]